MRAQIALQILLNKLGLLVIPIRSPWVWLIWLLMSKGVSRTAMPTRMSAGSAQLSSGRPLLLTRRRSAASSEPEERRTRGRWPASCRATEREGPRHIDPHCFAVTFKLPAVESAVAKAGRTTKRTGPENRADALGEVVFFGGRRSFQSAGLAVLSRLGKSQSRYRIWSVQNRSSRCSDLFRVANSSFEMPPTCSTVLTCFW
jgi:hypothetical protein